MSLDKGSENVTEGKLSDETSSFRDLSTMPFDRI